MWWVLAAVAVLVMGAVNFTPGIWRSPVLAGIIAFCDTVTLAMLAVLGAFANSIPLQGPGSSDPMAVSFDFTTQGLVFAGAALTLLMVSVPVGVTAGWIVRSRSLKS